ncbi:hypothetical protein EfmJHP10_13470 [Enterococcus faecium]|nr:hypothetical protein EfmJHP10_13470 [Enterococcus faecium]
MKNDLQISQETELEPIVEVASKLDLNILLVTCMLSQQLIMHYLLF